MVCREYPRRKNLRKPLVGGRACVKDCSTLRRPSGIKPEFRNCALKRTTKPDPFGTVSWLGCPLLFLPATQPGRGLQWEDGMENIAHLTQGPLEIQGRKKI